MTAKRSEAYLSEPRKSRWSTLLLAAMVVIFTIALVVYPEEGFEAGLAGLKVFLDVVLPSLLPFFILSELMLGFGVVHGLGVLLEPLMKPLFSVPGCGAFALSMGLAAGYPMDAVITARFRETGMCTRVEGERLLAFTNTADPLFMFGAVAVGMFKSPEFGVLLAVAHYVSAFLVGVSFKLWGRRSDSTQSASANPYQQSPVKGIFRRAYHEMMKARQEDGRAFGRLLHDAVTESINTLLMICGFIMFFAVLIEILRVSGIIRVVGSPIALMYHLLGIHQGLVGPTLAGLLEIDIGTAQTASVTAAPVIQKVALASAIIAWSGLAVHAQVASVLTQTDIRMAPYFLARLLHALFAAAFTVIFWWMGLGRPVLTVFGRLEPPLGAWAHSGSVPVWTMMRSVMGIWFSLLLVLLAVSLLFAAARRVRVIAWHTRVRT
jgi:sporulation integral membrane protein YlbJ